MKNLFRFAMAVAVLFTASCAKEDISSSIGGGEVEVTFTANLADLGTRAIGDGTKANQVFLAIYEAGTNNALDKEIIDPTKPIDVVDKKASISVVLLKDKKYDLVFWAQNSSLDCFELNVANRYMEIDYTGAKSQVEKSDAFFLVRNNWKAGEGETTFELRRPFAQLNVGLSENEVSKVTKNGVDVKQLWSKAVVKGVANVLDLGYAKPGAVSCSDDFKEKFKDGVTFRSAAKPKVALEVSDVKYEYLSMNYLLVEKTTIDVTYTFEEQGAEDTDYIRPYYNVPVQRNYRTNIVGNLLSSEYDFNVIIVPGFLGDNDTTVEYPEEGKLENLITPNLSKKSAQIILQSDVTWTTGAGIGSTPLIPEGAVLEDLTIQGGEVSRAGEQPKIIFNGAGVGAVRAANGGTITFRNVTIVDESESYAENSWEYGYLELGGKLVFENCTFVNAMMFEGTEATFTNCNFNSNKDSEYALWVSDGDVTVSESTIEGPRGIKVHEAYGSEVASVAIDKCQFKGISKKPALAIGDVNTDTAISITNCTIDAQPGDQGLYIYETDTDVNTFDFVLENNKVAKVVTTDEDLATALKANVETMTIILKNDLNVVSGHGNIFGGENTKTLTIMGHNGTETLNFTTDYMPTMNCAGKMIVKNLKITRVAPSKNTWDVRDLMLCSDIEMKNVTLEKGVAVCGDIDCKFTNVKFAESGDYYALWIEAAGANVELDGCTVTSAGRGIKIDEQYLSAEEKALVNLSVAGTTFNTKNKAAILVKSATGAKIAWGEGNNISKVAADKVNAVWVDENAAETFDLVEVTGCTKMLEGALNSIIEDLKSGEDVTLTSNVTGSASEGGYSKAGIVLNGQTVDGGGHTLTVNGANSTWDCAVYHGGGTLKNITVAGAFRGVFTAGSSSDIILDNVIFKDVVYTFNSDDGNKEYGVYISNSTLNGWTSHSDVHKEVVYTNCSFGEGSGNAFCRPYGPTKFVGCEFAEGYTLDANQTDKISLENCTLNGVALTAENFAQLAFGSATVDGVAVQVISDGVVLVDGAYCLSNKAGLAWFANQVNAEKNAFTGKTVKLTADIDLQNAAWTPVGQTGATQFQGTFDGNGKTIYNLNIDKTSETGKHYSSGLFGWLNAAKVKNVTVNGATVKGNHNVGVIAGYLETSGCTIENCHVIGAAVECHHANDDACGDKCGGIVGHAGNAGVAVKDCTVADSTVKAGRDAGQVVGAALAVNVTGCSATNVEVTANGECTGANVRNEVIGRLL